MKCHDESFFKCEFDGEPPRRRGGADKRRPDCLVQTTEERAPGWCHRCCRRRGDAIDRIALPCWRVWPAAWSSRELSPCDTPVEHFRQARVANSIARGRFFPPTLVMMASCAKAMQALFNVCRSSRPPMVPKYDSLLVISRRFASRQARGEPGPDLGGKHKVQRVRAGGVGRDLSRPTRCRNKERTEQIQVSTPWSAPRSPRPAGRRCGPGWQIGRRNPWLWRPTALQRRGRGPYTKGELRSSVGESTQKKRMSRRDASQRVSYASSTWSLMPQAHGSRMPQLPELRGRDANKYT